MLRLKITLVLTDLRTGMEGKIHCVLGPISYRDAGITLTHEHLSLVFNVSYVAPTGNDQILKECPFTLNNLGWIRQNPYSHLPNLLFNDKDVHEAVLEEIKLYKSCGGGTIVENTTHGLSRELKFLERVSIATGVNIVAGTGFYVASSQPASFLCKTIENLAEIMRRELWIGCEETNIKCGVIGELGCSWPLHAFEKKVLVSAAIVQQELGYPVMIHPGRNEEAPNEIMRIFLEAGGNREKTVMAHLDRTLFSDGKLEEFASIGTFCEFDLFGIEVSHYQMNESVDMPSDAQRIKSISTLVKAGFEDKIVISQDIHTKHRLMKFGGHGYSHILKNVVPKMMSRGITQNTIEKILIHNPQKWLSVP